MSEGGVFYEGVKLLSVIYRDYEIAYEIGIRFLSSQDFMVGMGFSFSLVDWPKLL